ncbi:MAG: sugar ABC transporter permease [Deltaproteobacteria bacterium]|nr:sugar ABC transporter permease [Deltaproteobacteria bacterium]
MIYPTFDTFRTSLYHINLFKGIREFVWFRNYINIFKDPKIISSFTFTGIFVLSSMSLHIILGIALALILNIQFRWRRFLRTIVLLPWAMPTVVIGLAAKWGFNNTYGFVNDIIRRFVPSLQLDWLIYKNSARVAVIVMDLWKDVPFFSILVLSALQFIPDELYEAAKIDGAGAYRMFQHITLPSLTKTILTLTIFFALWRLTMFDLVYSMTSGGPGESTALLAYRISMEAFTNMNLGYAASLGVILFLIIAMLSGINLFTIRRKEW